MPVSFTDLTEFHAFVVAKLNRGEVEAESLSDLAAQWEAARETEEVVADIHASLADIEAGRVEPLADAVADIRRQLGLPR